VLVVDEIQIIRAGVAWPRMEIAQGCSNTETKAKKKLGSAPDGWVPRRRAELFLGTARCSLRLVAGRVLLVMHGVVLLLILMLGVLIYRMLYCFLMFWVLIMSIWMLGIALRVLCSSFLFVHKSLHLMVTLLS
jgi:hypothetical protein